MTIETELRECQEHLARLYGHVNHQSQLLQAIALAAQEGKHEKILDLLGHARPSVTATPEIANGLRSVTLRSTGRGWIRVYETGQGLAVERSTPLPPDVVAQSAVTFWANFDLLWNDLYRQWRDRLSA